MTFKYRAFSFGAGVQSTALMLLIKHDPQKLIDAVGHLPDAAFFADTGVEVQSTLAHLEKLKDMGLPVPLHIVSEKSMLEVGSPKTGNRSFAPYFTRNEHDEVVMLRRKCTKEFKIEPIERAMRREIGLVPRQRWPHVAQWLGISTDEADRMKPNQNKRITNIYPLIELNWSRRDCLQYCSRHGIHPPKSRCFMCPFIKDWPSFQRDNPEDFQRAVEFDAKIRNPHAGFKGQAFIHRRCLPLAEAVKIQEFDRVAKLNGAEPLFDDYDSWSDECFGVCGT